MRTIMLVSLLALTFAACANGGVVLRYQMTPGETLAYEVATSGVGTVTAAGRTDPLNTDVRFVYEMTCTAVDEEGNLTIRHQVRDLVAQAETAGRQLPVSLSVPTITTVIAPTGAVLSSHVEHQPAQPGAPPAPADEQAPFDMGQFIGELRGPGFPEQAVEPGERWEQALRLLTQAGQPMIVKHVTRFIDHAMLTGRPCVRLQTEYELPLELSLAGAGLLRLAGKQTGNQIAYFDHEAGRVLRFDGASDTTLTMSAPPLFGTAGAQQSLVALTLRSTTSAVLQPQAAE